MIFLEAKMEVQEIAIVPAWENGKIKSYGIYELRVPQVPGASIYLGSKLRTTSNFTAAQAFVEGFAAAQGELEV